jgi:hypothetical protein
MRAGTRDRAASLLLALGVLVTGFGERALAATAADTSSPNTNVTYPSWDGSIPLMTTVLKGTATDDIGVASVRVAIMDRITGRWWHEDGTWGTYRWHDATLSSAESTSTGWSFSWPVLSPGDYGVRAEAADTAGNLDPTPAWVRFSVTGSGTSTGGRYLTITFGRTQWVTTENCRRMPNTIALDQVADAFDARNIAGTGVVVVSRTLESSQYCQNGYTLHPSWEQLAQLRDGHGWAFVSGGLRYRNITLLSPSDQWQESCGSLQAFEAHGHQSAWGLFGYPNNKWTTEIQRDVVSMCFAYGRTYAGGRNRRSTLGPPWFQRTNSINGGKCNNSALACYNLTTTSRRYVSPNHIAQLFNVGTDEWVVVQMYRFVTGAYRGSFFSWDCTSSDWRDHWTSNAEMYCWGDFTSALNRIPTGVTVTDPAGVADAWGRSL